MPRRAGLRPQENTPDLFRSGWRGCPGPRSRPQGPFGRAHGLSFPERGGAITHRPWIVDTLDPDAILGQRHEKTHYARAWPG